VRLFVKKVIRNIRGLLREYYFSLLIADLIDNSGSELKIKLGKALAEISKIEMSLIKKIPGEFYYYLYMTIKLLSPSCPEDISIFMTRSDLKGRLTNFFFQLSSDSRSDYQKYDKKKKPKRFFPM
jgi:hypothetical protein